MQDKLLTFIVFDVDDQTEKTVSFNAVDGYSTSVAGYTFTVEKNFLIVEYKLCKFSCPISNFTDGHYTFRMDLLSDLKRRL